MGNKWELSKSVVFEELGIISTPYILAQSSQSSMELKLLSFRGKWDSERFCEYGRGLSKCFIAKGEELIND